MDTSNEEKGWKRRYKKQFFIKIPVFFVSIALARFTGVFFHNNNNNNNNRYDNNIYLKLMHVTLRKHSPTNIFMSVC